jgi:hypothetical protein
MPVIPVVAAIGTAASAGSAIANAVGGSKNKSTDTVSAEQMIPDFQSLAGQQLSDWVTKYLPNYKPGEAYTGKLTTSSTDQEKTGLSQLSQILANSATGDLFSAGKNQIMDTLSGKYANPETSPYIQAQKVQANKALEDAISTERGRRGARGTYFTKAGVNAEGDITTNSLNNLQSIIGSFIQNERQNQLNAASTAANMDQYQNLTAPLAKVEASQKYGGLERTIDMANIEKQYQDYLRQRTEAALPVAAAQSLYGTQQPYGIKDYSAPQETSTLTNILGLVGKLGGLSNSSGSSSILSQLGSIFK